MPNLNTNENYCIELDIVKRPRKEFYLLPEVEDVYVGKLGFIFKG